MRFRRDNRILYGQDHQIYIGIPSGVDFRVVRNESRGYTLSAFGYGQLDPWEEGSYGNGSLYVWNSSLNWSQRRRFEAATKAIVDAEVCPECGAKMPKAKRACSG
jgi:hypothetical protein